MVVVEVVKTERLKLYRSPDRGGGGGGGMYMGKLHEISAREANEPGYLTFPPRVIASPWCVYKNKKKGGEDFSCLRNNADYF